jgi:3-deoxy-manno-octulosonate cytidylyltransferase (CMP-KDO synthetase)
MKIIGIIPSRYASTRFPGKPLIDIGGKAMIRRVYEQAIKAKALSQLIVATDDERIFDEVISFGGKVVMTSPAHRNGTERCAEVSKNYHLGEEAADVIINIQGDEPFIQPEQIDLLASCFQQGDTQIATLIREFKSEEEKDNPSRIKAFVDTNSNALMFSRSATNTKLAVSSYRLFKHIGIYGYRTDILLQIVNLLPSPLELSESLEQLRWLENGYKIKCALTDEDALSIDTPADLEQVKHLF